jgi:hypothetical protein
MSPKEALDLAKLTGVVVDHAWSDSPGMELLREKFSPDARVAKTRKEFHFQWWREIWDLFRAHQARLDEAERQSAWQRIRDDPEACMLLANYVEDAYREPLADRRRMLQHAVIGLFDLELKIAELARVWRIVSELDPSDILTLYGLWLVPGSHDAGWPRYQMAYEQGSLDALTACGAVSVVWPAHSPTRPELSVTKTGSIILAGLRSFLATRSPPLTVHGHEITAGYRSEAEAREFLKALPLDLVRRYANRRFDSSVDYDGLYPAAHQVPNGKARLVVRMKKEDAITVVQQLGRRDPVKRGTPVDCVFVEEVLSDSSTPTTHELVLVAGPHDVMRYLAYDLFARWWPNEWFRRSEGGATLQPPATPPDTAPSAP